jgi:hypothetical protein
LEAGTLEPEVLSKVAINRRRDCRVCGVDDQPATFDRHTLGDGANFKGKVLLQLVLDVQLECLDGNFIEALFPHEQK